MKFLKLFGLAGAYTSSLFVVEAFMLLYAGFDFKWVEPNRYIALIELSFAYAINTILFFMLFKK